MPIAPSDQVRLRIMWASGRPLEWKYITGHVWLPVTREEWVFESSLAVSQHWDLRYAQDNTDKKL